MYKPIPEIEEQKIYNNITAWHEAGITGKGVTVWNTEGKSNHSDTVSRRIYDAAPEATIVQARLSAEDLSDPHVIYNGTKYGVEEFIRLHNIRVLTRSIGGEVTSGDEESAFWKPLQDKYKLVIFCCSGNSGEGKLSASFPSDIALYVGAVRLKNGTVTRESYSSTGEEVDFCNFTGIWSGTSFSTPYTAGMAALLIQKHPTWGQADVYRYFKEHCKDFGEKGKDEFYGEGVPVMGEVREQNIIYTNSGNKVVDFDPITSTSIKVNGKILETNRILCNSENYVRLRDFEDVLGVVDVEYDAENNVPVVED